MPTPYSPGRRQGHALQRHLGAVVLVGDLDQDAGTVAHQLVGAHRAAVVQVLQDLQALHDDGVRLVPLDVGDKTDATGVVFLRGGVQAPVGQVSDLVRCGGGRVHGALQAACREGEFIAAQQTRQAC